MGLLSDGRYKHKGKIYSSFRMFQLIEGGKILFLLILCLAGVSVPFFVNGTIPRAWEQFHFTVISSHFSSIPNGSEKAYYIQMARQDAMDAGIPPDFFVRQIALESGFNPNSYSPAGAVGIAQFLPSTAAGLGVDPYDPQSALRGAAFLMASYQKHYHGDYRKALAAYNGGTGRLNYCIANFGVNWFSCEPAETKGYIFVIMGS